MSASTSTLVFMPVSLHQRNALAGRYFPKWRFARFVLLAEKTRIRKKSNEQVPAFTTAADVLVSGIYVYLYECFSVWKYLLTAVFLLVSDILKMMFGVFWKQYSKVEQTDENSEDGNLPWNEKAEKKAHLSRRTYLPWLLHFVVIFAYSIMIFVHHPSSQTCSPCFNENLLGAPIVWEDRTFTTNAYENNSDPYSRHNPDVDLIWNNAIEYKILVINEEEKQKLPGGADSAKAYGGEEGYAVGIEMFHQLHCLNHLREFFWKGNRAGEVVFDPGDHADHCFSYLFQTLLCFADVELTTQTWTPEANLYQPTWNLTKQCRNPEVIKEWQGSREAKYHPKGHRIEN